MTFFPLKFYSVEFSIQHASNRLDSSGSSVPGKTKPLHFKGRSHCGFSSKGVFVMEHKIHNRNNHLSMWIDKNSPRLRLIPENSEECSTKKKKKKVPFLERLSNICLVWKDTELNILKMSRHTVCSLDFHQNPCLQQEGQNEATSERSNICLVVVLFFVPRFWFDDEVGTVEEMK